MRPHLIAVVLVAVAACGDDVAEPAAPGTVPAVSDRPSDDSTPPLTATPLVPETAAPEAGTVPAEVAAHPDIQAAVGDLAARQGVTTDEIDVVVVREVTWSDGSLGCPQRGMSYTQALVNGQLVVLGIGTQRFEYHSGPNRSLFFCADPRPPVDETGGAGAGDS